MAYTAQQSFSGVSILASTTHDFIFDASLFSPATGFAIIDSPFSLAIDIANITPIPIYFGITVYTYDGQTTIADRVNIGFVASNTTKTISSASVPSLASIRGTVTKIVVTVYKFQIAGAATGLHIDVALRLDSPLIAITPQEYIGADSQAIRPGINRASGAASLSTTLLPATTGTQVSQFTMSSPFRFRVRGLHFLLEPTPSFPGDTRLNAYCTTLGTAFNQVIAQVFSKADEYVNLYIPVDIVLNTPDVITITGDNVNVANSYDVGGNIFGELIF